jgi:hypothetical protein
MGRGIPKDRFGKHAAKWYKKARNIWEKGASGGYSNLGVLVTDLSDLGVRGLLAARSLIAEDPSGLPLRYMEITRAGLVGNIDMTVLLDDELPKGVDLLPSDVLMLVYEIPGAPPPAPTVKTLSFDVALVDDEEAKVTIKSVATPTTIVPGIYEGTVRGSTGTNPPKPTGIAYAFLKIRVDP